jgi:hypothetical protein
LAETAAGWGALPSEHGQPEATLRPERRR